MKFIETRIDGCFILELDAKSDDRGFFARVYCQDEFRNHGLDPEIAQINTGFSISAGTLRGMHFQRAPAMDTKLVKCSRGEIFDVCLDLRPESKTFREWVGVELSSENRRMLFLPVGTAHGYQTLVDHTEIIYTTNRPYVQECAAGVRFNDPVFGIDWPLETSALSKADRSWPDFHA